MSLYFDDWTGSAEQSGADAELVFSGHVASQWYRNFLLGSVFSRHYQIDDNVPRVASAAARGLFAVF